MKDLIVDPGADLVGAAHTAADTATAPPAATPPAGKPGKQKKTKKTDATTTTAPAVAAEAGDKEESMSAVTKGAAKGAAKAAKKALAKVKGKTTGKEEGVPRLAPNSKEKYALKTPVVYVGGSRAEGLKAGTKGTISSYPSGRKTLQYVIRFGERIVTMAHRFVKKDGSPKKDK